MRARFTDQEGAIDYEGIVRCFGYGVPDVRRLLSSADNSLTLIALGRITPLLKEGSNIKPRGMKLHALPWPRNELAALLDTGVTLRVSFPISSSRILVLEAGPRSSATSPTASASSWSVHTCWCRNTAFGIDLRAAMAGLHFVTAPCLNELDNQKGPYHHQRVQELSDADCRTTGLDKAPRRGRGL